MNTAANIGHGELLSACINEVLAAMFFAEALPQCESSPFHDLDSLSASAEFHGDREGWMWLSLSQGCLRRLASSFLGTDTEEDVTSEDLKQVLCELANMICGSFLSRTNREGNFMIRAPLCPAAAGLPPAQVSQHYDVEGGSMQVRLAWAEAF
jgi:hypothetical protein